MSWKFNPPPGWPVPDDDDWLPPPGWAADPSWPPAPPGWEFWVQTDPSPPYQEPSPGSPGFPSPPPRGSGVRIRGRLVIGIVLAVAVTLLGCSGAAVVAFDIYDGIDPRFPPSTAAPEPGSAWDSCVDEPNTCNSGPVRDGGTLTWGAQSTLNWNLHTGQDVNGTLAQIMAGVAPSTGWFLPDSTWHLNLDLLVHEPLQTGEDPVEYEYRIRPEARWSDGTAITAADFDFRWRHGAGDADLCAACPATRAYDRIESVTGSDDGRTVTVTLYEDQPDPEWWALFDYLYPAHLAEEQGFDLETPEGMADASEWFADTVPDWSGGPWQVTEGDLLDEVVLEPNDQWYGQLRPALDTIVFEMIADPDALRRALESGEIDGYGPIRGDPSTWATSPDLPDVLSHVGNGYDWEHLDLNLSREGLDDVALRRAIFTAVDVDEIIITAYPLGTQRKLNHLFPPDSLYHRDHLTGTGQGIGEAAAALDILEGAGYELEDGALLTPDGEQVGPLVLRTSLENPRRARVSGMVADQLAEIGIEVEEQSDLSAVFMTQDYDLALFAWTGSPLFAEDGYLYWHNESGYNAGGYANDGVDSLVSEARYAPSQREAADLLDQAMRTVVDDAYVLPIAHTPQQIFVRDYVRNIRPHPGSGGALFANSHEWGLATDS